MAGPATKTIPKPLKSPAVPWIVLLGGLALSVIVAISVWTELKRQDSARFERLKERVFVAMDGRFRAAAQAVYGGRALVESTGDLSRAQWTRFVDSVWPFFERGVIGIGYVQRVPREQLDALETRVRVSGRAEFNAERAG